MVTLKDVFVKGYVTAYDPSTHTIRAVIPGRDNKTTGPIQILEKNSMATKHQHPYSIGEQVVIVFDPESSNLNEGWVLGSPYSSIDTPPQTSPTVETAVFSDGTVVSMDTANSNLSVNCPGTVTVKAETIRLQGSTVTITADTLGINGTNTTFGGSSSNLNINGTGDVVVNGISLVSHVHGGVQSGGSSTSRPK